MVWSESSRHALTAGFYTQYMCTSRFSSGKQRVIVYAFSYFRRFSKFSVRAHLNFLNKIYIPLLNIWCKPPDFRQSAPAHIIRVYLHGRLKTEMFSGYKLEDATMLRRRYASVFWYCKHQYRLFPCAEQL